VRVIVADKVLELRRRFSSCCHRRSKGRYLEIAMHDILRVQVFYCLE